MKVMNSDYLWLMVFGSPTVGGFAGYLSAETKNTTNQITPANTIAFFTLEPGRIFLANTNTIPNNAPYDIPNIVPATISPPFCQNR